MEPTETVTELVAEDGSEAPAELEAMTVNVKVPGVREVMSHSSGPDVQVQVKASSSTAVATYRVIVAPPSSAGADQEIVAVVPSRAAAAPVGAPGAVGLEPPPPSSGLR